MHFQVRMNKNGTKNIFWDIQTAKNVPLMLLGVKVLTET